MELRYSVKRLIGYILLGLGMAALCLWVAHSGIDPDYEGRGAFWVHLLGPTGTIIVFAAFGIASLGLAVLYLRLLFGARVAASADRAGLQINGALRRHRFDWREVAGLSLVEMPAGRRSVHVIEVARAGGGKPVRLPLNTVEGGPAAATDWLRAAERLRRGG